MQISRVFRRTPPHQGESQDNSNGRRPATAGKRRSTLFRLLVIPTIVASILVQSGCAGWTPTFFPTRPYVPFYVANRDGHYFVGSRCATAVVEAGIFTKEREGIGFDEAIWHVVSDLYVQEFEIYSEDQPGVTMVFDDGDHPLSTRVRVIVVTSDGDQFGWWLTLDQIDTNTLFTLTETSSPDEFWAIERNEFGC